MFAESGQTKSCLKILHLEDDPLDAELIKNELETHGITCLITPIHTFEEFTKALEAGETDLILSDSSLPGLDTVAALKMTRERRPELPFIFVSGSISPHAKAVAFREGATDFISKDNLPRLGKVVNWMRSSKPGMPLRPLLPPVGNPVMVQSKGYRCLGYLDKNGTWRDYSNSWELTDVSDWWEI
jgi:CheY-like chemotaxis protein